RVLEHGVLPAVIEMEMGVDHDVYVSGTEVVLGERVGGVAVDDLPFLEHVERPADAGVDEDGSRARVLDHKAVNRDVIEGVDPGQVEPDDFHRPAREGTARWRKGRTAAPCRRANR